MSNGEHHVTAILALTKELPVPIHMGHYGPWSRSGCLGEKNLLTNCITNLCSKFVNASHETYCKISSSLLKIKVFRMLWCGIGHVVDVPSSSGSISLDCLTLNMKTPQPFEMLRITHPTEQCHIPNT